MERIKKSLAAYSLLLFLALTNIHLKAQENKEANTVFSKLSTLDINFKDFGFFVAPAYSLTQMAEEPNSLFHVRGGFNYKDKWSIGGYFNTALDEFDLDLEDQIELDLNYWSVGGFIEYTLYSKKMLHLTFPLYIGYAELEADNDFEGNDYGDYDELEFFEIEPSALLELNLHKHIRFNIGAGYRFSLPMDEGYFNDPTISGFTANFGLKFGLFR